MAAPGATEAPASAACVETASPAPAPTAVSCGPGGRALRGACPKRTFSRLIFLGLAGVKDLLLAVGAGELVGAVPFAAGATAVAVSEDGAEAAGEATLDG